MVMDNTWLNNDGLYVKFGKTEGVSRIQGGFECGYGPFHDIYLNMFLTQLDQNENIQNDVIVVPANSLIESVEVWTLEAAATGAAIDVGLIANDRNASNSSFTADPDGLLAAFPLGSMDAIGEYNKYTNITNFPIASNAFDGALIGTIITVPTLITASATTGTAFTAGKILIHVRTIPMALTGYAQVHVG